MTSSVDVLKCPFCQANYVVVDAGTDDPHAVADAAAAIAEHEGLPLAERVGVCPACGEHAPINPAPAPDAWLVVAPSEN